MKKILIVGAGFSGSVMANELSAKKLDITLIDSRDHLGGNCYTYIEEGIIIHKYGPHIFHTNNKKIWNYINNFSKFENYTNRVKTVYNNNVYSLPINLHTINQFYKKNLSPSEAEKFINKKRINYKSPKNFEEMGLSLIGPDLYKAFIYGYTKKQWGVNPKLLPSSILTRLPLRYNYDDNYYFHNYQGMPVNGYTPIFEKLISKKNINLKLNKKFNISMLNKYDHVIFTGPIDEFFDYVYGMLEYRTLNFIKEKYPVNEYQGNPVINYSNISIPYTRITEHKLFHKFSQKNINQTIIFKEYSFKAKKNDEKYYPVNLDSNKERLEKYKKLASKTSNVSFVGRLGTFKYLDMDVTIEQALNASKVFIKKIKQKKKIPTFFS